MRWQNRVEIVPRAVREAASNNQLDTMQILAKF
jgi:hypothetical protein